MPRRSSQIAYSEFLAAHDQPLGLRPERWEGRQYAPTLALCNDCGTVRELDASVRRGPQVVGHEGNETNDYARCLINRKCATCGRLTVHAFIRTDPFRNYCEVRQFEPAGPRTQPVWCRDCQDFLDMVVSDVTAERVRAYHQPQCPARNDGADR